MLDQVFKPPTKHESCSTGKFHHTTGNSSKVDLFLGDQTTNHMRRTHFPPLPRLLINKEGTRKGVMVVSGISAICFWQKTLCESHFYFTQVNKYRVPFAKTKQYLVNFVCKGSNQILSKHHSHHSKN